MDLSESFYMFLVLTASGIIGVILKVSYESKCKEVECCCIKIKRDTAGELSEDRYKLEHGIPPTDFSIPMKKEAYEDAL